MSDRSDRIVISARQRSALHAVCDTLLPSFGDRVDDPEGLFALSGADAGTHRRVEDLIAAVRDPGDRKRLLRLLDVLESRVVNLLLSGRPQRFSAMNRDTREVVLRAWARSRVPLRRAGFQALKRLAHVSFVAWPPAGNGSHPAWRVVGHPGPLPHPDTTVPPLPEFSPDGAERLECDVVVVGSGAGGGVVAGLLAESGRDVIVIEKGPNPSSRELTQVEGDMLGSLYLDSGLIMTQSGSMPILAGSCVGGGTTINYTSSFALPEAVRSEWDQRSGLSLFGTDRFAESLARVHERVGVGTRWTTPARRDQILEAGCRQLGWHVDTIPRNVTDCQEGLECGFCSYGCRHGAKNSTARTYLTDAVARGARLIANCEAQRVVLEGGRCTGVTAAVRGPDGSVRSLTVRAKTVVVAAGALYTAAILRRSGVPQNRIGRGLHLQPATAVLGIFPDRVEPWSGSLQTRYSDEFADLHDGYGVKLETAPAHFALVGSAFGWDGARQWREDVAKLGHVGVIGLLLRDRDPGRIAVGRDGHPRVHYELSDFGVRHARRGVIEAARLLGTTGAREVWTLQTPPVKVRTDRPDWLERFTEAADRRGYRRCRTSYISFHQLGGAAMGADARRSVTDGTGAVHGVRGLYVADGSTFPASSGVNPMITIMAVADHVGRGIAQRA
jgi:choline dehydrogenase-like flavoprotein